MGMVGQRYASSRLHDGRRKASCTAWGRGSVLYNLALTKDSFPCCALRWPMADRCEKNSYTILDLALIVDTGRTLGKILK